MVCAASSFARQVAAVLLVWGVLLMMEGLGVAYGYRVHFAGTWEFATLRNFVLPFALALLVPFAIFPVAIAWIADAGEQGARERKRGARVAAALIFAAIAAIGAWSISGGRRVVVYRFWVIGAAVIVVMTLTYRVLPSVVRVLRRRWAGLIVGCVLSLFFWWADGFLFPRLYPEAHAFAFALLFLLASLLALPFATAFSEWSARLVYAIAAVCMMLLPMATGRIAKAENLRMLLVERAPILGRAVLVSNRLHPPIEAAQAPSRGAGQALALESTRALDWSGRDILVLSIDALRADHVSAYGYARKTTPHIDALAKEGMLFRHAFCPTPHTSYSTMSLMTGKYMRPVLALGAGNDSDTWAALLRRYEYRTAAFYPPAVFFVDEQRFTTFRDRHLDFEYYKVEFAAPALRVAQVADYMNRASTTRPLFLWVHFFEPHEPYIAHPAHPFGDAPIDRYDSEIATVDDGIGELVRKIREKRPNAVIVLTADHGEEFGEHGGRYHGTTVYEEQVRVPLIVVGPGVASGESQSVVQTIDLMPTVFSALGIPRPARVRGRDLGPILAGKKNDQGFAFAETEDASLVARGSDRLVCNRKAGACALFDVERDPGQTTDRAATNEAVKNELHGLLRKVERDHGRYETPSQLPEALRRGMQGDVDAAEEVASLLDDANLAVRRKAAEVGFRLHAPSTAPHLRRALERDEDAEVRKFAAVALVRIGEPVASEVVQNLMHEDTTWRRRLALSLAEHKDPRLADELVLWLREPLEFEDAREVIAAVASIKARSAVPALVALLPDVRLRPHVADALGAVGDPSARGPLLDAFVHERYVHLRGHDARALAAVGGAAEMRETLARFAGTPEPMPDALAIAADAGLLKQARDGWQLTVAPIPNGAIDLDREFVRTPGAMRLLILASPGAAVDVQIGNDAARPETADARGTIAVAIGADADGKRLRARLHGPVRAAWLVPLTSELEPPPPAPWTKDPEPILQP